MLRPLFLSSVGVYLNTVNAWHAARGVDPNATIGNMSGMIVDDILPSERFARRAVTSRKQAK